MSATETPTAPTATLTRTVSFRPPAVDVGMGVLWFQGGKRTVACPAIVTEIGHGGMLFLSLVAPHSKSLIPKVSVRHIDDPAATESELRENGAWEHTPLNKKIMALVE